MYGIIIAALVAAFVTSGVTPFVRAWVEKRGAIDLPEERRVNETPKPRAGGIAIFTGFIVAILLTVGVRHFNTGQHAWTMQITGVLLAVTFVALTGLVDDFKNKPAKWQALAIVGAALILYAFGIRIEGITNPFGPGGGQSLLRWHELPQAISLVLTVLWVFTVTKTVDAIDGVDGLAAGGVAPFPPPPLALMATLLRSHDGPTVALLAAGLTGACLGFLRHNYFPSKIIMGLSARGCWGLRSRPSP